VPYKGPTLAASVYGDVALREFGDLDILVPRRDVPAAKRALLARGYAGLHALSPAQEAALVRSQRLYEMGFFDANRRMLVEIHWQAGPEASTLALDDREWWAALDRMELEGRHVACLTKPEMLLVLCLHGTKHFWASLGWLVDLAEMVRDDNLDWKWLLARARQLGCERRIGLGLHLAASLLGANLPAQARAIAGDTEVARISARIANSLFSAEFVPLSVLQAFQLNLRLCDRASQRVRRLWDSLMSPGLGEWERWPLPRALFFLYVPLRLARLARKYALPSWGPREHAVPTPARRP
jgi:hypothetical protein